MRKMVRVENTDSDLWINELTCFAETYKGTIRTPKPKKIGVHRRKAKGKTYENPVIHLPTEYSDLIGSECWIYKGTAELKHSFSRNLGTNHTGELVILFIPKGEPEVNIT